MNQYKKFFILASLSTIVTHSAPTTQYAALEPDEPNADARPVKAAEPVAIVGVNRKPAVEPRVYVENGDLKTGYVYYDMPGQVAHSQPKQPQ